jgi:hypothetical protein
VVAIWHTSSSGLRDEITRPVDSVVALFWRFVMEKFGIHRRMLAPRVKRVVGTATLGNPPRREEIKRALDYAAVATIRSVGSMVIPVLRYGPGMRTTAGNSRIRGDPVTMGLVVVATFGALWSIAPLFLLPLSAPALVVLVAVVVAAAVAVLIVALRLRGAARGRTLRRVMPDAGRKFNLVNVGQTVLIIGAVAALIRAGRPGLIPVVTCLVVGLHFLPLARIFDLSPFWLTGALLVAVAAAGGIGYTAGLADSTVLSIVGFGATAVLWTTGLVTAKHG